jgi:hypothetical protein
MENISFLSGKAGKYQLCQFDRRIHIDQVPFSHQPKMLKGH